MNIKKMLIKKALSLNIFEGNPNTQTTETADLADEMKTYYTDYIQKKVQPKLYHEQFAQKKNIPPNKGKTIEFRRIYSLPKALKPLVEGVTPDGNTPKIDAITAELHQYGDYITVSDILKKTTIDPIITEFADILSDQAALTIDTVVREVLNGTTSVYHAPIKADGEEHEVPARHFLDETAQFTPDCAFVARTELAAVNARPINDDAYTAIIHPFTSYDIMRNKDEWIPVAMYAKPENYFKGEVGMISNVRFVETTEAKIFYGDDLSEVSRNLTVNAASSGNTITVKEALEANALVGRFIIVNDDKYEITANTANTITLDGSPNVAKEDVIYPGEGGAKGLPVMSTMVLGADAYATSSLEGGGIEHIYQAPTDPLHQRQTLGWKATKAAVRLNDEYMMRIESVPSAKFVHRITVAN